MRLCLAILLALTACAPPADDPGPEGPDRRIDLEVPANAGPEGRSMWLILAGEGEDEVFCISQGWPATSSDPVVVTRMQPHPADQQLHAFAAISDVEWYAVDRPDDDYANRLELSMIATADFGVVETGGTGLTVLDADWEEPTEAQRLTPPADAWSLNGNVGFEAVELGGQAMDPEIRLVAVRDYLDDG